MHSEHLRNVQLSWVAFGWFVGLATATSIALLLMASGVLSPAGSDTGLFPKPPFPSRADCLQNSLSFSTMLYRSPM